MSIFIFVIGAGPAAIDRYLLLAGPTATNTPHAAAAGEWDRQTDGPTGRRADTVPFHGPYYAGSADNNYDLVVRTMSAKSAC